MPSFTFNGEPVRTENAHPEFRACEALWFANVYRDADGLYLGAGRWRTAEEARSHQGSARGSTHVGTLPNMQVVVPDPLDSIIPVSRYDRDFALLGTGNGFRYAIHRCRYDNRLVLHVEGWLPELQLTALKAIFPAGYDSNAYPDHVRRYTYRHRGHRFYFQPTEGVPVTFRKRLEFDVRVRTALGIRARAAASTRRPTSTALPAWARTLRGYGHTSPAYVIREDGTYGPFYHEGWGIEIETVCRWTPTMRHKFGRAISDLAIDCKSDGSLINGGIEVCPQPFASSAAMIARLSLACEHLPQGQKSAGEEGDGHAGTHIHVSGEHADLPDEWWELEEETIDLLKRVGKSYVRRLGSFSERQWSWKSLATGTRGWWHKFRDQHVEFRGFGPVRDAQDVINYIAVIKAALWTAASSATGPRQVRLFWKKLERFGWVNKWGGSVPSYEWDHSWSRPKPEHKVHGNVLGKEVAAAIAALRQKETVKSISKGACWQVGTSVKDFRVGMHVRVRAFMSEEDRPTVAYDPSGFSSLLPEGGYHKASGGVSFLNTATVRIGGIDFNFAPEWLEYAAPVSVETETTTYHILPDGRMVDVNSPAEPKREPTFDDVKTLLVDAANDSLSLRTVYEELVRLGNYPREATMSGILSPEWVRQRDSALSLWLRTYPASATLPEAFWYAVGELRANSSSEWHTATRTFVEELLATRFPAVARA